MKLRRLSFLTFTFFLLLTVTLLHVPGAVAQVSGPTLDPTTVPKLASTKQTPVSRLAVPLICFVQVTPPLVVRRTVPLSPTVVPDEASVKETANRVFVVPLDWLVQVVPPSVV